MCKIPINIVFEDSLSEAVLRKLLSLSGRDYALGTSFNSRGSGWIRSKIRQLNASARGMPYLVLTDLDRNECAPAMAREWLPVPRHPNLIFRVAVREVEAWLLGGRAGLARFLGVSEKRIPSRVDEIDNPKEFLLNLARRSRRREVRQDMLPASGSTARVGPDYAGRLIRFVEDHWDVCEAQKNSRSLRKIIERLETFEPVEL